jgi:hypothetical protein
MSDPLKLHLGKTELISLVSNSIHLCAKRALDEKEKELNHSSKPHAGLLPPWYVELLYTLSYDEFWPLTN